jgi:hypothetical protein
MTGSTVSRVRYRNVLNTTRVNEDKKTEDELQSF